LFPKIHRENHSRRRVPALPDLRCQEGSSAARDSLSNHESVITMSSNQPILIPRTDIAEPSQQKKPFEITTPIAFSALTVLLLALYKWPLRWFISGAPELTFFILLGASKGRICSPSMFN
jgi:hypothetical protein